MADDNTPNSSDIPRGLINRTGTPIGRGSRYGLIFCLYSNSVQIDVYFVHSKNDLFFRLPSVRGHRDLTLGGVQRKVFAPNLAAVKKSINKEE